MRRLRVTPTLRRKLEELRELASGKGNHNRGGVMLVPKMLSVDEWDAVAGPQQARLVGNARDDDSALTRAAATAPAVVIPEPVSQAEHERHYEVYRKEQTVGPRDYLAAKKDEVDRLTSQPAAHRRW